MHWRSIREGMEMGFAILPESKRYNNEAAFIVLRIKRNAYPFALYMASEKGAPLSLTEWAKQYGLYAGINAGMYLPDKLTSIGYMRSSSAVNNQNMGSRLGAFFVAEPKAQGIDKADIIERGTLNWQRRIHQYGDIAQNYRLMDSKGTLLWNTGGPKNSIAVVGKDKHDNLLFVLCQEQLAVEDFCRYLTSFVPGAGPVMYVEGGVEAGIFLRVQGTKGLMWPAAEKANNDISALSTTANGITELYGATANAMPDGVLYVWKGRRKILNLPGNASARLPNIIGVPLK